MVALLTLALWGFLFFVVSRAMKAGGGLRAAKLSGGRILARGLVLSASPFSGGDRVVFGQKFELRDVVLDVEIPGKQPYEVACTPMIPRLCEARPGAALDLGVNPRRPNDITVLGPAGSYGWLPAAARVGSASLKVPSSAQRYVLAAVVTFVPSMFALGVFANIAGHTTAPAARQTSTASTACADAVRCCHALGSSDCTQFNVMSASACSAALQNERRVATKAHKKCP